MKEFTFDLSLLSSAFQGVKENHGCPGVDGVTIEVFERDLVANLKGLQGDLTSQTYFPLPLLKILVDKGNGETRALCVPSVRDRVVETAALLMIEPILEPEFEDCSFAYRKGHSVRQAVYKIKEYYEHGYRWVASVDVDAYFDNVDHSMLLEKFNKFVRDSYLRTLIELWVKAEIWDGESLILSRKGIPQGSPVSPILANLFLDEPDEELLRQGYKYIRFSDDWVILAKSQEEARDGLQMSKKVLSRLLLQLDDEQIVNFDQGFTFLGVTFVRSLIMTPFDRPKKEHKVLFYPPSLNLDAYLLKKKKGW